MLKPRGGEARAAGPTEVLHTVNIVFPMHQTDSSDGHQPWWVSPITLLQRPTLLFAVTVALPPELWCSQCLTSSIHCRDDRMTGYRKTKSHHKCSISEQNSKDTSLCWYLLLDAHQALATPCRANLASDTRTLHALVRRNLDLFSTALTGFSEES